MQYLNSIESIQEFSIEKSRFLSKRDNIEITESNILEAIFLLYHKELKMEILLNIWDHKYELNELHERIDNYNFLGILNPIILDSKDYYFEPIMETKVKIKTSKSIWIVHKYDKDPFPSTPHAHNYESNLKLNVYTGEIFKGKECISKMRKKDLNIITKKLKAQNLL